MDENFPGISFLQPFLTHPMDLYQLFHKSFRNHFFIATTKLKKKKKKRFVTLILSSSHEKKNLNGYTVLQIESSKPQTSVNTEVIKRLFEQQESVTNCVTTCRTNTSIT